MTLSLSPRLVVRGADAPSVPIGPTPAWAERTDDPPLTPTPEEDVSQGYDYLLFMYGGIAVIGLLIIWLLMGPIVRNKELEAYAAQINEQKPA